MGYFEYLMEEGKYGTGPMLRMGRPIGHGLKQAEHAEKEFSGKCHCQRQAKYGYHTKIGFGIGDIENGTHWWTEDDLTKCNFMDKMRQKYKLNSTFNESSSITESYTGWDDLF